MSESAEKNQLGKAAATSKNITAIIGLSSGLVGILVGTFGFAFFIRDELEIWDQVKRVHVTKLLTEGTEVHNHKSLSDGDIAAIKARLNLPDFSNFGTLSESSASDFVRYTDKIAIYGADDSGVRWSMGNYMRWCDQDFADCVRDPSLARRRDEFLVKTNKFGDDGHDASQFRLRKVQ